MNVALSEKPGICTGRIYVESDLESMLSTCNLSEPEPAF